MKILKRTLCPENIFVDAKRRKGEPKDEKQTTTKFEDLSNELFHEIFDYLGSIETQRIFSKINKNLTQIVEKSSLPLLVDIGYESNVSMLTLDHCLIFPQRRRIRSIKISPNSHCETFFQVCRLNKSFVRLESIKVLHLSSSLLSLVEKSLKKLPQLRQLEIHHCKSSSDIQNISATYRSIFQLKYLKKLRLSLDCSSRNFTINSNRSRRGRKAKPIKTSLEQLHIDHSIEINDLLSILSGTPKLRCLKVQRIPPLNRIQNQKLEKIPTLFFLEKLTIEYCLITAPQVLSLLNSFQCRLKVLRIKSGTFDCHYLKNRWEILSRTTFCRLERLEITIDQVNDSLISPWSQVDFVFDSFWSVSDWDGKIMFRHDFFSFAFRHSNSFYSDQNRFGPFLLSPKHRSVEQENRLSSTYSIDWGIDVRTGWNHYFPNSSTVIKDKTIKNLKLSLIPISGDDLIKFLRSFPNLQYLDIDSSLVENETLSISNEIHNLKRLRIRANSSSRCFAQLMRCFTNLNELELDCEFYWFDSQNFFRDFTFQDCLSMSSLRKISFLKPKQPKDLIVMIKLSIGFQGEIIEENSSENEFTLEEKYRILVGLKPLRIESRRIL